MPRKHVRIGLMVTIMGTLMVALGAKSVGKMKSAEDGDDLPPQMKGYLIAAHVVQVGPVVNGRIMEVLVEEGQAVKKGQVLARLDSRPYELDLDKARAQRMAARARLANLMAAPQAEEVKVAELNVREAEEQLAAARADEKRVTKLGWPPFTTGMAALEVDKHKANLDLIKRGTRKEEIEMAQADLRAADAVCELARYALEQTTIQAPLDGVVLTRRAEVGTVVDPKAVNLPAILFELANLAELEVDILLPEKELPRLAVNMPCHIRADAYPRRVYEGRVSRIMPVADRAHGAIPVRIRFALHKGEQAGQFLKPEMAVTTVFSKH